MKRIVILVLALLVVAGPAKAESIGQSFTQTASVSVFLEAGISDYERPQGSLWQQAFAGYWTDWGMTSGAFRIGLDHKGFRLSYFDLGTYYIAAEAGDDEGAVEACKCVVPGDSDMYFTKGNIRGVSLTYKTELSFIPMGIFKSMFVEGGGIGVRYAFQVKKDDGFQFDETLYGYGHMIGAGFDNGKYSIGFYGYRTKIGGKFGNSEYPSGTGGANVLAVGIKF